MVMTEPSIAANRSSKDRVYWPARSLITKGDGLVEAHEQVPGGLAVPVPEAHSWGFRQRECSRSCRGGEGDPAALSVRS